MKQQNSDKGNRDKTPALLIQFVELQPGEYEAVDYRGQRVDLPNIALDASPYTAGRQQSVQSPYTSPGSEPGNGEDKWSAHLALEQMQRT